MRRDSCGMLRRRVSGGERGQLSETLVKVLMAGVNTGPGAYGGPSGHAKGHTHTLIHTLILLFIYYLNSVLPMFPSND